MVFLLIFFISLLFPSSALASGPNFSTSVETTYTFSPPGTSEVKEAFLITNLSSNYLISSYDLFFNEAVPSNLSGFDDQGKLTMQSQKTDSGTLVRIFLNSVAAGKGKSQKFYLTYTGSPALKIDHTWKITLPPNAFLSQVNDFTLNLNVPLDFGPLVYSTSSPNKNSSFAYTFTDSALNKNEFIAIFSHRLIVGFHLEYLLKNDDLIANQYFINLPSDTSSQKIIYKSLLPHPENIIISPSGAWQAVYSIPAKSSSSINLIGQLQSEEPNPQLVFSSAGVNPNKISYFQDNYAFSSSKLNFTWKPPWQFFPFFSTTGNIEVTNSGNSSSNNASFSISAFGFSISSSMPNIITLPPFAKITIPVKVWLPLTQVFSPKFLVLNTDDSQVTYNISSRYFLIFYGFVIALSSIFIIIIAYLTHHTWDLYLQKRRQRALRRQG